MISGLDLNLMLVLHTVLVERNVARAAERLHVTPSAVSNSLARLREQLRDPLITRKGRGIVPTPRALEIAPVVARALREVEEVLAATPFDAATCTRTFTLAIADLGQITSVPRIVARMARALPHARLRVLGIEALVALGGVSSDEIDLHVGIAPMAAPGLHAEKLFDEKNVLVVRKGHPALRARHEPLRHVRVDMLPAKNRRDPLAPHRDVVVTVPSFTAAAEIVAHSDLATLLPASFLAAKGEALGLRSLKTSLPARPIAISMCWHERTHADRASRAFRELVKHALTS